jgi:hypothetical protein
MHRWLARHVMGFRAELAAADGGGADQLCVALVPAVAVDNVEQWSTVEVPT